MSDPKELFDATKEQALKDMNEEYGREKKGEGSKVFLSTTKAENTVAALKYVDSLKRANRKDILRQINSEGAISGEKVS